MTPGIMLQRYLMSSYLYYDCAVSVMSDSEFDMLCMMLAASWDTFEHPHKYLVTIDDLAAGTGYAISEYPMRVRCAAHSWHRASQQQGDSE